MSLNPDEVRENQEKVGEFVFPVKLIVAAEQNNFFCTLFVLHNKIELESQ